MAYRLPDGDLQVLAEAMDGLDEALVVWQPHNGTVSYANRIGREQFLSPRGSVIDPLRSLIDGKRDRPSTAAPCGPLALDLRGYRWFVRTRPLTLDCESIVGRRHSEMSERELLQLFQTRYRLADRKTDVLRCILRGRSTSETSAVLRIAYPTVRRHLVELMNALGVKNKFEIFCLADAIRSSAATTTPLA